MPRPAIEQFPITERGKGDFVVKGGNDVGEYLHLVLVLRQ
jgi:hypothetical protein